MTGGQEVRGLGTTDSPILYLGISKSYLRAFEILWRSEFEDRHPFYWDRSLIFHPISHVLGLALETSMKGLLVCRGKQPTKKHDLEELLELLNDPALESEFSSCLKELTVPRELLDANSDKSVDELEAMYRMHQFHFQVLNSLYDRPFATRYPVLGGIFLPNPTALASIARVLQQSLEKEARQWSKQQ